jgi:putative transposase
MRAAHNRAFEPTKSWSYGPEYQRAAARRFLEEAMALHGEPEKITIDKSGANTAAIESYNARVLQRHRTAPVQVPQQYRRARSSRYQTDRSTDAGFKVFRCARILITGIETMHMIRKGQLDGHDGEVLSAADQFYSLAF